jgi:hypothetical protein
MARWRSGNAGAVHRLAALVRTQGRASSIWNCRAQRIIWIASLWLFFVAPAAADPRAADAALELQIFLHNQEHTDYRVLSFDVVDARKVGEVRRTITYRARVEFPSGLSPAARAALRHENISVQQGDIETLSSRKIIVNLEREAVFVLAQNRWAVQIGTTRYLLPQ